MKVTVLGHNGHLGIALVEAFADAGHEVTGFGRSNKHPDPRVRFVQGDAEKVEDIRAAIADADVVVNALNLRYDLWDKGRLEAQAARVVAAMGTSGKTMMFAGSIYNFPAASGAITPDAPQIPPTSRGVLRIAVEGLFEAAARRGDMQAIIIRAGDFFGPESSVDWFDQAILREAAKGRVAQLGSPGVAHTWAYLPDLTRAFVRVAEQRHTLARFERLHFAGNFVTPEEMTAAIQAAAPVSLKPVGFPWFVLSLMGITNGVIRGAVQMRYLWEHAMALKDDRLTALLGPNFGTPFETAIATSVARYFPAMRAAA